MAYPRSPKGSFQFGGGEARAAADIEYQRRLASTMQRAAVRTPTQPQQLVPKLRELASGIDSRTGERFAPTLDAQTLRKILPAGSVNDQGQISDRMSAADVQAAHDRLMAHRQQMGHATAATGDGQGQAAQQAQDESGRAVGDATGGQEARGPQTRQTPTGGTETLVQSESGPRWVASVNNAPGFTAPDRSMPATPWMPHGPQDRFSTPRPGTSPTGNATTDAAALAANRATYQPGGATSGFVANQPQSYVSTTTPDQARGIASRYGDKTGGSIAYVPRPAAPVTPIPSPASTPIVSTSPVQPVAAMPPAPLPPAAPPMMPSPTSPGGDLNMRTPAPPSPYARGSYQPQPIWQLDKKTGIRTQAKPPAPVVAAPPVVNPRGPVVAEAQAIRQQQQAQRGVTQPPLIDSSAQPQSPLAAPPATEYSKRAEFLKNRQAPAPTAIDDEEEQRRAARMAGGTRGSYQYQ